MTWFPTETPRPGSTAWAAQRILRLLEREEQEAAELRRLKEEGWRPPRAPHPGNPDDGPVFGDGRDAIVDYVQADLDRRQALLDEARRRIAARENRDRPQPAPTDRAKEMSEPLEAAVLLGAGLGGLLAPDQPLSASDVPVPASPAPSRSSALFQPHPDPRLHPVMYRSRPELGLGGRGLIPPRHGGPLLGGGGAGGFGGGGGAGLTLGEILRLLFGAAGIAAGQEAGRPDPDQSTMPPPGAGPGPSLPPSPISTAPDLSSGAPSRPLDSGRIEGRPPTLQGGFPGYPGSPEPPRDRDPERPKPPALQAYPGLVEWIEQEGLILQNSKGDPQTQADNDDIIKLILKGLEARGIVAKHVHGGKEREKYYPDPISRRTGSGRTDGQIEVGDTGEPWDFNTTDMLKDRETPTARERRAIEKIKRLKEVHYKGRRGYLDTFPKSRGWDHAEWRRAMAEAIDEFLDARFGPPRR